MCVVGVSELSRKMIMESMPPLSTTKYWMRARVVGSAHGAVQVGERRRMRSVRVVSALPWRGRGMARSWVSRRSSDEKDS